MTNLTNDVPVTDEQHPLEAALDGLGLVLTDDPDFDHDEQTFGRAMDTALSRLTSQPVTGDLVENWDEDLRAAIDAAVRNEAADTGGEA